MSPGDASGSGLYPFLPYCGAPPDPAALLHRWNLDPVLLTVLAVILVAYAAGDRRRIAPWRRACFYGGWALGTAALVSPLCPLSVSLFSARVAQHMLLATVVAPLVALGRPGEVLAAARSRLTGRTASKTPPHHRPILAAAAFAVALWIWHAPGPYTATFETDAAYWAMHLTVFGAALWLWSALLEDAGERLGGFVVASLLTTVQMGLLGAIITFAGRPLYLPHLFTTAAWGLSPLEDQQLGGVVMWVPAGAILAVSFAAAFTQAMRRAGTRALHHSPA